MWLEKERVIMVGKGIGKIRGEAGEVTGVVENAPITDSLEKDMEHLVDGGWQLGKWRYSIADG